MSQTARNLTVTVRMVALTGVDRAEFMGACD